MTTNLAPLFDKKTKDHIISSALKVLKEIGIECSHEKTVEMLQGKTKIDYVGGRMRLDPDAVMSYIDSKKTPEDDKDKEFGMVGPWCSFEICDPVTGDIRPPSEAEVINAAKLIDSITVGWGPFGGCVPMYVSGVPARLATLKAEQIAVTYTRKMGGKLTVTDRDEIELITGMYKVAGRRYKLALQGMISPLRLNTEIMDTFFEQDGNKALDMEISCAIPMSGATAPVVFPAGLIQCVAEAMAVDFIFNLLSDRKFDSLVVRLEPFDMKSNNIVFGSPEWCVLNRACVELEGELRGRPRRYGVFRSNSRRFDAQSVIEGSMVVLFQALNGVRKFGAVGQLCVDEVFSPLQAVLDIQILKYVKRVLADFNGSWDEEADYMSILREGIADGTFMGHDTTVENFRKFYSYDHLFKYCNLNSWRSDGMKGLEDDAREELKRIVDSHDFELDDAKKAEIARIYSEGEKLFLK